MAVLCTCLPGREGQKQDANKAPIRYQSFILFLVSVLCSNFSFL